MGRPINVTDAEFAAEVLEAETPVLVDYWAPWCGPCSLAGPVLEKLAAEYRGRLKVVKLNVDEQRQVAMQYGIMSVPTLHLFREGVVVDQMGGVTPNFEDDLRQRIEQHV